MQTPPADVPVACTAQDCRAVTVNKQCGGSEMCDTEGEEHVTGDSIQCDSLL